MRQLSFLGIVSVLLVFTIVSCSTMGGDMEPVTGASAFYLNDYDLEILKEKALDGDAQASFQVYQHYELGKRDSMSSLAWLQIAANKDYAKAQYALGYTYAYNNLLKNIDLAKYWLHLASKNGLKKADELIEELQD